MNAFKARIMLVVAATLFLSACNTMQGFGRDVERAGDKIEDAAARRR